MKYEKPELVVLSSAVEAVQSSQKNGNAGDNNTRTAPAYEADE
jgi:hypothetical protein